MLSQTGLVVKIIQTCDIVLGWICHGRFVDMSTTDQNVQKLKKTLMLHTVYMKLSLPPSYMSVACFSH